MQGEYRGHVPPRPMPTRAAQADLTDSRMPAEQFTFNLEEIDAFTPDQVRKAKAWLAARVVRFLPLNRCRAKLAARRRCAARSAVPVHARRAPARVGRWDDGSSEGPSLLELYSRLSRTADAPEAFPQ